MKTKKIFFFGTPTIAVPALDALAQMPEYEVSVVTFPDKPVGRKQVLTPSPVKECALKHNLPLYEVSKKKEVAELFQTHDFDLGLVIAFGVIFPGDILDIPEFGVTNVHFSLLPELRGASPVQSAILEKKKTSGLTFQRMVYALDAGDIQLKKEYNIENKGTIELFNFFAQETATIMPTFLSELFENKIEAQPQDAEFATFCGKFEKSDGEINFKTDTASDIWHKYLAFDLWPGIFMLHPEYDRVKILELSKTETEDSTLVQCADGEPLHIVKAQIAGKKPASGKQITETYPNLF